MPDPVIARRRLRASGLDSARFERPEDVVGWLGAVQAQDYAGAAWGLGQRLVGAPVAADIDAAFDAGRILRTHALRPTWHFLAPADIRWVLALTSPRVHRLNALYYRRVGLDGPTLARGTDVVARALEGGRHLTRAEIAEALAGAGIDPAGRVGYLLIHAELEGIVVSGPRRGKQFTYALLDERAPIGAALSPVPPDGREAALAELTRRYFASHGPAQPRDFAWWSSLTLTDAREGLALAADAIVPQDIDGATWWWAPSPPSPEGPRIQLLPNYDEYAGSYRDHRPTFDPALLADRWGEELFAAHLVVRDGLLVGGWKRDLRRDAVIVRPNLVVDLDAAEHAALEVEAERYGRFVGLPSRLEVRRAAGSRG